MGLDESGVAQLSSCCPTAVMMKELGHQEGSVQGLAWTALIEFCCNRKYMGVNELPFQWL